MVDSGVDRVDLVEHSHRWTAEGWCLDCEAHAIQGQTPAAESVDEILRLRSQLAGAVEALKRYGAHSMTCTVAADDYAGVEPKCSCGYDAVLDRLGRQ